MPPAPVVQDAPAPEDVVARIRAAFRRVVGQPIAPEQNFFDAGASSLQLVRLHIALRDAGLDALTLIDLFAHPSPRALATHATVRPDDAPPGAAPGTGDACRLNRHRAVRARRNGAAA